ncbi:permease-like cell division protein FtsX [Candidatus Woesebacteria bacterium]|nr:permease-like cell division protein FtsX [Candidatus Woesebacteria bacterium]
MNSVWSSMRRTPYQTFASFSVLFFTLLLSGLLFISLTFLQSLLQYVETRPRIIVYFQITTSEEDIFAVRDKLVETEKTNDVTYVSKEDAYKIYKDFTQNDPLLLEMTSPDILPASLEIDAKQPEYLEEIVNFVRKQPGVDEVQFQKDIVDNLLHLTARVRVTTAVFFTYLLFMSIIVLTTTTSFKVALKKDEISLLSLLGATKRFIRKPFMNEIVTLGLVSSVFANLILVLLLLSMNPFLSGYFAGIHSLNMAFFNFNLQIWPFNLTYALLTIGVTTVFSLLITFISSFWATNRYL